MTTRYLSLYSRQNQSTLFIDDEVRLKTTLILRDNLLLTFDEQVRSYKKIEKIIEDDFRFSRSVRCIMNERKLIKIRLCSYQK